MCGIVGAVAKDNIVPTLLEGLRRLEYRGYDSAGIALNNGALHRLRTTGRVAELSKLADDQKFSGEAGIAHTRWATHGAPSERNAHPHISGEVAVVHNGIIENHEALRQRLQNAGFIFTSDTDTEVIAHLITLNLKETPDLFEAVCRSVARIAGSLCNRGNGRSPAGAHRCLPQRRPLYCSAWANHGTYAASDASALLQVTRRMVYLEEGDVAEIRRDRYRIVNAFATAEQRKLCASCRKVS